MATHPPTTTVTPVPKRPKRGAGATRGGVWALLATWPVRLWLAIQQALHESTPITRVIVPCGCSLPVVPAGKGRVQVETGSAAPLLCAVHGSGSSMNIIRAAEDAVLIHAETCETPETCICATLVVVLEEVYRLQRRMADLDTTNQRLRKKLRAAKAKP